LAFGATHLTQQKQTFYNDNSVKLEPALYGAYKRAQVKVAKQWDIVPELSFQMQDSKYEVAYGAHAKYYLALKSAHTVAINMGAMVARPNQPGYLPVWTMITFR
jgi:hypothetical protein